MNNVKRTESTDSLSAWSPFKCVTDKHAQRYFFSNAVEQRKLPRPIYLDRTVLDRTFRWLESNFQSTDGDKQPRMMMNTYRAENASPKQTIKVIKTKEYKQLQKDFVTLKNKSIQMLICGNQLMDEKWSQIADSIQAYLKQVREFFDNQRIYINSIATSLTLRDRTLALERLKKLYTSHVSQMDDWIEMIVK